MNTKREERVKKQAFCLFIVVMSAGFLAYQIDTGGSHVGAAISVCFFLLMDVLIAGVYSVHDVEDKL